MKSKTGIFLSIIIGASAVGADFVPKKDNKIVALDLLTGEMLWTHDPGEMSDAHFEVYGGGVVAYPHYGGATKKDGMFLDSGSGTPLEKPFETDGIEPLARSATFSPEPEIELENGWALHGFSAGNTKTLGFVDKKTGEPVWKIPTTGYPHQVRRWKNFVFYAFSYLSKEGILYAYEAGDEKPSWQVDLNGIVKGREKPLTRMIFQVIEDVLYLEANEHIFAFEPGSGKLLWHRDLSKDLGMPFFGGFYGGGLNLAVFAKSGDTLVIAFELRVVALDLKEMKYRWHFEPDTFPHCPFPAVHGGKVFLSSGKNGTLIEGDTPGAGPFPKFGELGVPSP